MAVFDHADDKVLLAEIVETYFSLSLSLIFITFFPSQVHFIYFISLMKTPEPTPQAKK